MLHSILEVHVVGLITMCILLTYICTKSNSYKCRYAMVASLLRAKQVGNDNVAQDHSIKTKVGGLVFRLE